MIIESKFIYTFSFNTFWVSLFQTLAHIPAETGKLLQKKQDNQKVQAIESSIDELNFLIGPSVFATVSNYINPIVALYIAAVSSITGTIGVVFLTVLILET